MIFLLLPRSRNRPSGFLLKLLGLRLRIHHRTKEQQKWMSPSRLGLSLSSLVANHYHSCHSQKAPPWHKPRPKNVNGPGPSERRPDEILSCNSTPSPTLPGSNTRLSPRAPSVRPWNVSAICKPFVNATGSRRIRYRWNKFTVI